MNPEQTHNVLSLDVCTGQSCMGEKKWEIDLIIVTHKWSQMSSTVNTQ